MLIKSISTTNIKKSALFIFIILCIICIVYLTLVSFTKQSSLQNTTDKEFNVFSEEQSINSIAEYTEEKNNNSKSYIKWVDFKGTSTVMSKLANLDISSHNNNDPVKFNWIELMSLLACKYGGDLSKFKQSDLDTIVLDLKGGKTVQELSQNYKLYNYYYESLDAIFNQYIGEYTVQMSDENGNISYKTNYGIKVYSPIAKGYSFSHYKDFGTARSYGYRRVHLGNDLLRKYWHSYYCC